MNEVRDYARECGVRCRQIRMAKGMSQQQLADKMSVTSAAVSKWEKEGISNIDHIKRISDVLGQDITADQLDQEGSIGEVGKEILRDLVMFEGYLDVNSLYSFLYGMKKDRVCNELFKLERIGTVVREQFTDFSGVERDGLFITAKGLIAYKNYEEPDSNLNRVKTLDSLLINDATSVQDVIDADVTTDFILNRMDCTSAYRLDYLTYLHDRHMNLIVPTKKMGKLNDFWWNAKEAFLCGESCYVDILRRMAQSASRKEMDETLVEILEHGLMGDRYYDKLYEAKLEATGIDDIAESALEYFSKISGCFKEKNISEADKALVANEEHVIEDKTNKIWDENIAVVWKFEDREKDFYRALSSRQKGNVNLWFSYDEIKKFIEENILPPSTEYEKLVDRKLHEIWEYDKTTLHYYYSFTESWEKNGLAQLIRDRVGVPPLEN